MNEPLNLPTPNLPLLRKVLEYVDAHPEDWDQGIWITQSELSSCGTACCIAGWATILSGDKPVMRDGSAHCVLPNGADQAVDVEVRAAELLGLTLGECGIFAPWHSRADIQFRAEQIAARAGERL